MDDLIVRARGGDAAAREELLSILRPRLRQWAEHALNARFGSRLDASDLTQITLLDVHQELSQFIGSTEGELIDWTRRVLQNNILDAVRNATAKKRTVAREQSVDHVDADGNLPRNALPDNRSTPSLQAMRAENADLLQAALARLPDDQGQVVRLVHLEGHSIAAAAAVMQRTPAATAKLLQRGMANLRKVLQKKP
jgi:RNA polymerase sigma-70 factor (ECF subfamily)